MLLCSALAFGGLARQAHTADAGRTVRSDWVADSAEDDESDPVAEAARLLDEDRPEEARDVLADHLKINPQSAEGLKLMGRALRELGKSEEAVSAYRRAAALAPEDIESLFWIGTLSRWMGRWSESLEAFSGALEIDPDDVGCLIGRARALDHLGTYDQAERDLRLAMRISPDNTEAAALLADVLARRNRLEEARVELERVYDPAESSKKMGDLYREKELYGEAVDRYRAALDLKPDEISWRRSLADVLRRDREFEAALEEYRTLAEADPRDADAHFWVGTILRWRGDDKGAEEAYRAALGADPSHAGAAAGLVRILKRRGRRDEALSLARRAVEISPRSAEAHTLLGGELAYAGKGREAVRHLERALELDPGDPEAERSLLSARRTAFRAVEARYKLSDAQALEGRERGLDADPYPIPMKYRSDEYGLAYEVPGAGGRRLGAEAVLSYDKLDNLRFDRTVYDVRSLAVRATGVHSLGSAGEVEGSAGVRSFADVGGGQDLDEKSFAVYKLLWRVSGDRDELTLRTDRDQVLVRGAAENTYFGIVGVTGLGAEYRRVLNEYAAFRMRYGLSDYADGNTTHYVSTGPDVYWHRHTFSPRFGYRPLQRYDLDEENRLRFVRIAGVGFSYKGYFGTAWSAGWSYRYSSYDDDQGAGNRANAWSGTLTYHPAWSGAAFVGAETEGEFFLEPGGSRRGYVSYDTEAHTALIGLKSDWDEGGYRLSLGRSWRDDEIAGSYGSIVLSGSLNAWLGASTKLTFDGKFYRDGLDDFYGEGKEEEALRLMLGLRRLF
jgi:tetratricopeptide (TPR) repeat protein